MKKIVRLTEGDLHRIVKESVGRILNEYEEIYASRKGKPALSRCGVEQDEDDEDEYDDRILKKMQ